MLNVLALDTATPRAAVAVATAAGAVHVARPDPQARHGRHLVPAIRDLLREARLAVAAIDVLAVGLGPGSYTGLRVGLTVAKVLAYAAGRPLIGFDSLEAIARNAPADTLQVAVIADAQRGDLYTADFVRDTPDDPLVCRKPSSVEPLTAWAARVAPGTLVLGPALELAVVRSALPAHAQTLPAGDEAHWPDARRLPRLALDLWERGRREDPWFLEPLYLRRSAAEDQWERKAAAAPP
jgi:tRNA threonylcarbamoyladenosine biosynthesis protein TsaB